MKNGIDAEKETLESLVRSCLLELNKLKFNLTELEIEKANDNSASRIQELEQDVLDKEKEVSIIKFKAEEEVNQLKGQLEEKDLLIKNQEDRIYELDYVNNSLDEIKEYFAQQLKDYKKNELSEINERLNESYKAIAEKDARINNLSRLIDDYKIQIMKLEKDSDFQHEIMNLEKQLELKDSEIQQKDNEISNFDNRLSLLKQQSIPKQDYDNLKNRFDNEIVAMDNEINYIKEQTIPKQDYDNLQNKLEYEIESLKEKSVPREEYLSLQSKFESELASRDNELRYLKEQTVSRADYNNLQNEILARDNELRYLKEQTVSREEYLNLQNELTRKNDKIKRLEEINMFFNELQEEQESYATQDRTPPFRLDKKEPR